MTVNLGIALWGDFGMKGKTNLRTTFEREVGNEVDAPQAVCC
jgi:hypothetical protein